MFPSPLPSVSSGHSLPRYERTKFTTLFDNRYHMGCFLGNTLPQILLGLRRRDTSCAWWTSVRDIVKPFFETLPTQPSSSLRPADNVAIFIDIIVKAPIVQILALLHALFVLALEFPAPFLKGTGISRSLPLRVILLLGQAFLTILFYQVRAEFVTCMAIQKH